MTETSFTLDYRRKLVAYIDVLGFKELIPENLQEEQKKERIEEYFKTVLALLSVLSKRKEPLEKLLLSDTILLTYPTQETPSIREFQEIALAIGRVQYALALKGIWTRGALTRGEIDLRSKRNIVVGPALVRAYQLEKEAKYPRVIVDPAILYQYKMPREEFVTAVNEHNTEDWKEQILHVSDQNEPMYIHFLGGLASGRRPACDAIYENVRKVMYLSQTHYDKYRWLVNYLMLSFPRDFRQDMEGFEQNLYNL
jgi:hypothetical protein